MEYASKTQHYLKVKKPLLERQRRARINKCLDAMKHIIAELQKDDAILRMDKAEMLETTIAYIRQTKSSNQQKEAIDSFHNGYINAANEVSRVLGKTQAMSADVGKYVMAHLGNKFNQLIDINHQSAVIHHSTNYLTIATASAPLSPTSSGYHSDVDSPAYSSSTNENVWRPW